MFTTKYVFLNVATPKGWIFLTLLFLFFINTHIAIQYNGIDYTKTGNTFTWFLDGSSPQDSRLRVCASTLNISDCCLKAYSSVFVSNCMCHTSNCWSYRRPSSPIWTFLWSLITSVSKKYGFHFGFEWIQWINQYGYTGTRTLYLMINEIYLTH